ncbi:hypothetical protein DFH08DRAFT_875937 [Mycena albidolilacea]|uniref:Uncharacterized protein n=1 Tax=Mycena albidolilacea TaxID=1033008 RepID=A0AAD6ZVU1_9AGAR|nr:hypothetical protein DFH08DRAFT_875937 [Mycena albidolilacea]
MSRSPAFLYWVASTLSLASGLATIFLYDVDDARYSQFIAILYAMNTLHTDPAHDAKGHGLDLFFTPKCLTLGLDMALPFALVGTHACFDNGMPSMGVADLCPRLREISRWCDSAMSEWQGMDAFATLIHGRPPLRVCMYI